MILEYQTEDILLDVPRKNIMIPRKITPKIQQFKQDIFLESLSIFFWPSITIPHDEILRNIA